jgi:IclR family acetate operon transcriptional repressor
MAAPRAETITVKAETGASAPGKPGPLAIERVFGILLSVATTPRGKSLTALSQELGTPKTSLLNLLPGLTATGYLVRTGRDYRLGPMAFQLAATLLRTRETVATVAQPLLRRLAEDTGKTVTFCVLAPDERTILHIAKEESRAAMRFVVEVGDRAPLHTTAGGRVILAFRPGDWAENFLRNARLTRQTEQTIVDPDQLRASLKQVRAMGYAVTKGETYENVGAVAAPVFHADGFLGAVVAAGAVEQVVSQADTLGALVRSTANEISALMGRVG